MRTRVLTAIALCLLFAPPLLAQTQITTGVIQGTVMDPQGAVVADASVEVRNLDTNFSRALASDASGRFVFLQLPPGRYVVTVVKAGFATQVQENLTLTVGQAITLNLRLKVSQVAETVTVSGSSAVDTSRSAVGSTLNENTVALTPILGRKFEDLLTLTPGVSVVQGPDGDSTTFVGQRGIFNNVSLDGGDYNNGFFGEQVGGQRASIDITLEAVKEFQVIATGANAEFGRSAGGIVNVITKSGTNDFRGSLFHFQRLEALTSEASDGTTLEDFHREQFGGTLGGPLKQDKAFFFVALEHISSDFKRPNLSVPIGTPCPVTAPNIRQHEALINQNTDCQRQALLGFFRTTRNQEEGLPIAHPVSNTAVLGKLDWTLNPKNNLSLSWNHNRSQNENQTFDVATYGNSANGHEGSDLDGTPSQINVLNLNLFSSLSSSKLNEFHFTYSRETRPRRAVESNIPADTAMGFATTFRFGNPFFLQPTVDELIWRTQLKNNFSVIKGKHTIKLGGEWMHTLNDQVFRGFFTGRYIFDSVTGFLRYASPAATGGYGPKTVYCSNGAVTTYPEPCPGGGAVTGGPLLLYLQGAGLTGPATDAAGASRITNEELSLFAQDTWQVTPRITLNYGLRWDAQLMPETVDPKTTAYGAFLSNPSFPSDGTIPDQWGMFQPRFGFTWDVAGNQKSVVRGSAGLYYARQNMLSQVGSVTTNGLQQQTIYRDSTFVSFADMPTWPNVLTPQPVPAGQFPLFSGVRVFDKDYKNPRIFTANLGYERELAPDWTVYLDGTWSEGDQLTRFLNYNVSGPVCCDGGPGTGNKYAYTGSPFGPQLGEVMVTNSRGSSRYLGATIGFRKRFSRGYQLEANYTLSKDEDDDSNERDPFTDRSFNFFDLSKDWGLSDRDRTHKFNLYGYAERWGAQFSGSIRALSAQPITPSPRAQAGVDRGRNTERKDNAYFSFDWRVARPFGVGKRAKLIPMVEMFNTFNNANNLNPLTTPGLFNFDGFLRIATGAPREVQLALKLTF
jgi:outer membrane receptor for ferrienterochelin and colicin